VTTREELQSFRPRWPFLVGIDSDGCAFDSMEIKWKECFIPRAIEHFGLQPVSKYARRCIEFVNLYSRSRGTNRFFGLLESCDWLAKMPEVAARGFAVPALEKIRAWCADDPQPTNGRLEALLAEESHDDYRTALAWSLAVNSDVARMVHGVPPFPLLRESLELLGEHADVFVVSSTPLEALEREWAEHGIADLVAGICGQETGSKKDVLETLAGGYDPGRIMMIGDAPGDRRAGDAVGAAFYPVVPGEEEASWRRFHDEAARRFLDGDYAGEYRDHLIAAFDARLPAEPDFLEGAPA